MLKLYFFHMGTGDHVKSFKEIMDAGIQIYTNDETVEDMNIRTGELMKGVPERYPFRVGSFIVTPFELPHTTYDKEAKYLFRVRTTAIWYSMKKWENSCI